MMMVRPSISRSPSAWRQLRFLETSFPHPCPTPMPGLDGVVVDFDPHSLCGGFSAALELTAKRREISESLTVVNDNSSDDSDQRRRNETHDGKYFERHFQDVRGGDSGSRCVR